MKKRQQQAEETKQKISETLASMLHSLPMEQINIRDLCNAAGVSTGAFYHHFSGKEEALLYCYHLQEKGLGALALQGDPYDNIRTILRMSLIPVQSEWIGFYKQLHIARINYHGYFSYSEEQPLFHLLAEEIGKLIQKSEPEQHARFITAKLIEQCRGYNYNLCIRSDSPGEQWYMEAVDEMMHFLDYCIDRY